MDALCVLQCIHGESAWIKIVQFLFKYYFKSVSYNQSNRIKKALFINLQFCTQLFLLGVTSTFGQDCKWIMKKLNLNCYHSNWSYLLVFFFSCGAVIMLYIVLLTFKSVDNITVTIQMKAIEQLTSCGGFANAVQDDSNFSVCVQDTKIWWFS